MTDTARCPRCGLTLPLARFSGDRSRSTGRRSWCKACEQLRRSGALPPKPAGLVLVPSFPRAPEPDPAPPAPPVAAPRLRDTYGSVVESWIAALRPPATVADGVLLHGLRRMAAIADDPFTTPRNETAAIANMTRLQRELLGTRATKAAGPAEAAPGSKLATFRDAL